MFDDISLLSIAAATAALWSIVIFVELFKRIGWLEGEAGRKTIHILSGILIATFPAYLSQGEIIVVNGITFLALVAVGIIHSTNTGIKFLALDDVDRVTYGHYLYPLSIILAAFMFDTGIVFSFIVLELALADGFAALFGKWFGNNRYYIPGGYKTWEGSATFFAITLTLLTVFVGLEGEFTLFTIAGIILGSIFLTFVEGIFAAGFDNLAIPIFTGIILNVLV